MSFKLSLLSLALLFLYQTSISAQISNPNANIEKTSDNDIWAKTLEGNHYNEFWNYQFYLNDGLTIHITYSVANFGSFKSPVSGVQVSVYNFDGNLYQAPREYPISYLIQDRKTHTFRLREGRNIYFRGKLPQQHEVRVNFSKDDVTYDIDLRLNNIHEGLKWGDGLFQVGREEVGIITHIPYAGVQGKVAINDHEKKVQGTAYMDHTYQNQTTTRLVHSGYRFVHHADKENWDLLYFMLPEHSNNNKTIGYRLVKENGDISVNGIENIDRLTTGDALGIDIARILDLNLENSEEIRISRTADFERFSVLGGLGWLAKRAAKSFLGGEVVNVRGEAILMETGNRPKNGYYNFFKID